MSGVFKGVKKVFKKVVKTAKKILPAALGVGALVFTAGAALGVLPSWGTAVSNLTRAIGGESTLTNVLTGAVTQAGYGAVLGGATAALTGGDVGEGAGIGAALGAVSGGVMGGFGFETDPLKGLNQPSKAPQQVGPQVGPPRSQMAGVSSASDAPVAGVPAGPMNPGATPAVPPPGPLDAGGWVERNQELVGSAIKGLGSGLLAGIDDDDDSYSRGYETRQALINRNYATSGGGLLGEADTAYMTAQPARPSPVEKFDPATYPGFWQYDPAKGRIVYVRNQQQQA